MGMERSAVFSDAVLNVVVKRSTSLVRPSCCKVLSAFLTGSGNSVDITASLLNEPVMTLRAPVSSICRTAAAASFSFNLYPPKREALQENSKGTAARIRTALKIFFMVWFLKVNSMQMQTAQPEQSFAVVC